MPESDISRAAVANEDVGRAARVLVEGLLKLVEGERLLVYVDKGSDPRVREGIHARATLLGAQCDCFELDEDLTLEESALRLGQHIRAGCYDVVCELSTKYFYRTPVARIIHDVGARVYWLPGLDPVAFSRCVGAVDHQRMYAFGLALRQVLKSARLLHVRTEKGTDLRMRIGMRSLPRLASRLTGRQVPKVWLPTGLLNRGARASFLGGQLGFQASPMTIEGTAVVDAQFWPPPTVGPLDEPLTLTIRRGRVVQIGGSTPKADILNRWFEGREITVEHFCMGFHPRAGLAGGILEAERAFGCISIGIGKGNHHTDGVISSPTIELDRARLEDHGSFVYGDLPGLESALRCELERGTSAYGARSQRSKRVGDE